MAGLPGVDELFEGRHFDREIIVLCVKWYLRFKLSFRDLAEMMAERGLSMAHTTIMRWVHHYVLEFERRWNQFARPVGPSWRVDFHPRRTSQAVRRNGWQAAQNVALPQPPERVDDLSAQWSLGGFQRG
jgi:hypothetical protein